MSYRFAWVVGDPITAGKRLTQVRLAADAEIHEQGNDGNGERGPGDGLGTDSGQDDDGAAEKDKREG